MIRLCAALLAALLTALSPPSPAAAQDRVTLGWGRSFANDGLGDGEDRWRTGAYTVSRLRGLSWTGALPGTAGEILEFRASAQIIAPENLAKAAAWDRRYAGVLSFGLFTHFEAGGIETSLGAGLQLTGKQTGIGAFQTRVHDILGVAVPGDLASQIPNRGYLMLSVEAGRSLFFGPSARLRPFVAAETGVETLARLGFDLSFGRWEDGALMLRDGTTGQRYRGLRGDVVPGVSLSLGGDIARVFDSALLPEGGAAVLEPTRSRLRAGVAWQGEGGASVFYGLTWLSKEFTTQPEAQVLGSLSVNFRF
jgi:hypothetical protein